MNHRLYRLGIFGAIFLAALTATVMLFARLNLRVALSDSATPAGVYRFRPLTRLARGDLVGACLPQQIAAVALSRGYLHNSPYSGCAGGGAPVGKLALALPGDTVEIESSFVAVNGQRFANSATATHDSAGRTLAHVPWGVYQVGPGECWLFGFNNVHSWDARYYGSVPLSAIRWSAEPILTWRTP